MAIDHRTGTKVSKHIRREDAPATRLEPYPYIGIVKNNLDPTKTGRLQVYIPDLGGDSDESANWQTVSYASPFMGYTNQYETNSSQIPSPTNNFENVTHTYGMWMVPPDVGVQVIVIFIAGDPLRGYFISCVNPNVSRHMLPGLAGSSNYASAGASADVRRALIAGQPYPTVEFNETNPELNLKSNLLNNSKPIHEEQFRVLLRQGLDRDTVRGVISSSSQREAPSSVFGISTPGRPFNDLADDPQFLKKVQNEEILEPEYEKRAKTRKGGHTFVLDDGDAFANNQLVRLRTARGHQILMHDTNDSIYISHASGQQWIEMSNDGDIKIFTKNGFSLRSEGTINLRSDSNINIDAGGTIKMRSQNKLQIESGTTSLKQNNFHVETQQDTMFKSGGQWLVDANSKISIKTGGQLAIEGSQILQNSGGTETVDQINKLTEFKLPDTSQLGGVGTVWQLNLNALATICTIAPSHEPFYRGEYPKDYGLESVPKPQPIYTGKIDNIKTVSGTGVTGRVTADSIRKQPPATKEIGPLSKDDLTAYYAQIGQSESKVNANPEGTGLSNGKTGYECVNSIGYVGKYQFGYQALIDQGYVRSDITNNSQLDDPNSWTGKNGISNKNSWLSNTVVQEQAMEVFTENNYERMVRSGAITADMPKEEISGMMATAHLLGATGAKNWRAGVSVDTDAYGTTGDIYFQKGKYAVGQMSPKVAPIQAG